jgi:hypothetical protein
VSPPDATRPPIPAAPARTDGPAGAPRGRTLRRIGLASATTLLSINIPTGFPLLALWVGAKFVGRSGLSMGAVAIVLVTLALLATAGVKVLTWLSARYDALVDAPPARREPAPWLRSLRAERVERATRGRTNPVDRIVVTTVVAAVLAFEVWFFFFAGSSLPRNA